MEFIVFSPEAQTFHFGKNRGLFGAHACGDPGTLHCLSVPLPSMWRLKDIISPTVLCFHEGTQEQYILLCPLHQCGDPGTHCLLFLHCFYSSLSLFLFYTSSTSRFSWDWLRASVLAHKSCTGQFHNELEEEFPTSLLWNCMFSLSPLTEAGLQFGMRGEHACQKLPQRALDHIELII